MKLKTELFKTLDDLLKNSSVNADAEIIRNIMEYIQKSITKSNKEMIMNTLMNLMRELPQAPIQSSQSLCNKYREAINLHK